METVFVKLLNLSITAGWLILAVLALRLILKKTPKWISCALWVLVGVRLCLPFSLQSALSLVPSAKTLPTEISYTAAPEIDSGIGVLNRAVNPALASSFAQSPVQSASLLQTLTQVAAMVWLAGLAAMLTYTLISYSLLHRRVQTAVRLEGNIFESENVASPFVLGLFRPRIYLPVGLALRELVHVVDHERAHIARRDHWIKPIGFLLLSVYWFNPLVWLAYILLCRDIEAACDEKVISKLGAEGKKTYSAALLNLCVSRGRLAACPLAFGETNVKQRIKGILNYKKPAFWIIIAGLVACAVLAVCFLTNPQDKLSDAALIKEAYPLAQSCAAVNDVEINRKNALIERKADGGIDVDFPAAEGLIRVSFAVADKTIQSAEIALLEPGETPQESAQESAGAQESVQESPTTGEAQEAGMEVFASARCLFMNPLSSAMQADGDNGYRYLAGQNSFTITNNATGDVLFAVSLLDWNWTQMTEEDWSALFPMEFARPDISGYDKPLLLKLNDGYYLFNMDGELWIGEYKREPIGMWSVFALTAAGDASVAVIGGADGSTEIYVEDGQAQAALPEAEAIYDAAAAQLDKPYEFGASGPEAFDSSGLIYFALNNSGMAVERQTCEGYSEMTGWQRIEDMGALQKGDILFFHTERDGRINHAGIFAEDRKMIHASSSNACVIKSTLSTYFEKHFAFALRAQ